MNKIRVFIVDDEEDAISNVLILLKEFYQTGIEVAGFAQSIPEAKAVLETQHIDLLFLDIELGAGTGFDLLKEVEKRSFEVIFITAYDHFALEAIRENTLAYMLKPVDPKEFRQNVQLALDRINTKNVSDLNPFLESLPGRKKDKLAIPVTNGTEFVNKEDILYVEADGSYSILHRIDHSPILVSKNLKRFEELLQDDGFLRIHKSTLINVSEIARYDRVDGEKLVMSNGKELAVSRRHKPKVFEVLMQWDRL